MAILVNKEYRGLQINSAHASVVQPSISENKNEFVFCVVYRSSQEHDQFTSEMIQAPYDMSGDNPYIQAYTYLKTLPEFASAVDC